MEKTIFISDLAVGDSFSDIFIINEVSFREDKNGNTYADISIGDKSGSLRGKIWSDMLDKLDRKLLSSGSILVFSGTIGEYRGNLQVNIKSVKNAPDGVDTSAFVRASNYTRDELEKDLKSYIDKIKNKEIKDFVNKVIYDKDVEERYFTYPAAKSVHHDFRHGLLHHVVEMLDIAFSLKRFYGELNFDIIIAGIVLHDIGKIEEFDYDGISAEITKQYWLYGHIVLGLLLVRSFYDEDIDPQYLEQIEHILLSHHGEKEFGSPVMPATPEAFVVAYADRLSSKIKTSMRVLEETPDSEEMSAPSVFLDRTRIINTLNRNQHSEDVEDIDFDQLPLS